MKKYISLVIFLLFCTNAYSVGFVAHPIFGFSFNIEKTNYLKPEFDIVGRDRGASWVVARYKTTGEPRVEFVVMVSLINGESGRHGDFGSLVRITDGRIEALGTADEAWFSNDFGLTKDIRKGLASSAVKLALSALGKKQFVKFLHADQGCHPVDAETKAVRAQLSKIIGLQWCAPRKLYPIQQIVDPD
jgi:hypothetical protein